MVKRRGCGRWCAIGLAVGALSACAERDLGLRPGADSSTVSETAGQDGLTGDATPQKPLVRVGGADPEGKGWLDWFGGKHTPEILKGPQGGQHIWVSARTAGLHPKKARITVTMFLHGSGGQPCTQHADCASAYCAPEGSGKACTDVVVKPGTVEMTGTLKWENDWLVYAGLPAFVKEPCVIRDQKVRVELAVDDLYGVHADDKAWITPVWKGYCEGDP